MGYSLQLTPVLIEGTARAERSFIIIYSPAVTTGILEIRTPEDIGSLKSRLGAFLAERAGCAYGDSVMPQNSYNMVLGPAAGALTFSNVAEGYYHGIEYNGHLVTIPSNNIKCTPHYNNDGTVYTWSLSNTTGLNYLLTDDDYYSRTDAEGLVSAEGWTGHVYVTTEQFITPEGIVDFSNVSNVYSVRSNYGWQASYGTKATGWAVVAKYTDAVLTNILTLLQHFNGYVPSEQPSGSMNTEPDPYEEAGTSGGQGTDPFPSGVDGGEGTFDWNEDSDDIDFNALPSVSGVDSGFITILNPTQSQLKALSSYMWSDLFSLDTLKKLFVDPMEIILGLNLIPVNVPQGQLMSLKVAGFSTGVSMYRAASQFVLVDCGYVDVNEYWGAYMDYSPYTTISLYLPYVGAVQLSTDDVMGRRIRIKYKVDILTGACVAQVKCSGGTHCPLNSVMYHFTGNCAINLPVTGSNFSNLISSAIQMGTSVAMFAAGAGGAGAAIAAGGANTATTGMQTAASAVATAGKAIGSTVGYVMSAKPTVARAGSIGSYAGLFGIQKPYLIMQAPRQSLASNYNSYVGYPSNITENLSTLKGFTSFEKIHLYNLPATEDELEELYTLLKDGVIF